MTLLALVAASLAIAPSGADNISVLLRETVRVDRPGTTAAYAVDVAIVEASVSANQVVLGGRSVGTTRVTVVGPGGIETWNVTVEALPSSIVAARAEARRTATWAEQYDSETSRVTTTLGVEVLNSKEWPIQLQMVNLTKARATNDGFARSAFPLASLSFGTPRRGLIIGDERVTQSPLTLDGTLLRGGHLRAGGLEVHAGFASALTYGSLFVPAARETALGASYFLGSESLRFGPSLYFFPDAPTVRPGARTVLPGFLVEKEGKDGLHLLAELGWSGGLAAAGEAAHETARNRIRARARHQPYAQPALSLGHPQGTFLDLSWSARVLRRLALTLTGASARYDDPRTPQRTAGVTWDLTWSLARNWSARGGLSVGRYDAEGAPRVDTISVPVGLAFDTGQAGLSALYRYQTNSATNRGGSGGRVAAHAGGQLSLTAFADYQRDAPTLSLVLRDYPEVARALAEQGLVARSPEDIARLLDASAPLLAGDGPNAVRLTLDPVRAQAGFDLTWSTTRTQVRLHGLFDRTETISETRETRLGTVSFVQRFGATEFTAAYTRWASDSAAFGQAGGAFQVGIRQRFSGGEPGSSRRARIAGQLYREGEASGPATTVGVPGVTVRLGDGRTSVTDAGGNFVFEAVGRRGRRVEAVLPSANAFFTTPSVVEVKDSGFVRIGLRFSEGRLDGLVHDDSGHPTPGLILRLTGNSASLASVSDSSGVFVFGAAEGDYKLRLDPLSLPAGYEATGPDVRDVRVRLGGPVHVDVTVRVQRSISGRLTSGRAGTEVRLRTGGRAARTDDQGRFLFRYVAPGPDTLEAHIDGRMVTRKVEVPEGPAMLRDIELDVVEAAPGPEDSKRAALPARVTRGEVFGVQVASLQDRAAAEAASLRLAASEGKPVEVLVADLGSRGIWYRVLIVGFVDERSAQAHRKRLLEEGREPGPVLRVEGGR